MASSEEVDETGADHADLLLSVNQAALKMPRPQIVTTRKDIRRNYEERLERFRVNCRYVQKLTEVLSRPDYSKEFLQRLEEAAESFHDLRGPMLARYPIEVSYAFRREQAEIVHALKMVPVFTKHAKELLNDRLESKNERNVLERCMYLLMNNCFNSLDVAHDLAQDKDYLKAACKFLKETGSKPDKSRHTLAELALQQIVYMSRVPANYDLLHEATIPKVLLLYTRATDPEFCLAALASLANIADGKSQGEDFRLSSDMADKLMAKIKEAWKSDTKTSTRWPFRELLEVVGSLAKNEDNRYVLVDRGCLSPLTHLVSSNVLQDEIVALRTLWRLSFCEENKKKMAKRNDLMLNIINKFSNHIDRNVIGLAHGVLLCLKKELMEIPDYKNIVRELKAREEKRRAKAADKLFAVSEQKNLEEQMKRLTISPESTSLVRQEAEISAEGRGIQVMLSYNRLHREKVKEICMFLLKNGFKVWFDMNNMTSDALDAMASAIETSDVICICYSQGYYDSQYCECEAKYAVQKKKRTVFIKMEDYTPCGWLGIMMGAAFYVDYTGRKDYALMRSALIDEILERRKNTQLAKMIEEKPTQEKEKAPAMPTTGKDQVPAKPHEAAASVAAEKSQKPSKKPDESRPGKKQEDRKMIRDIPNLEDTESPTVPTVGKNQVPAKPHEAAAPVASEKSQKPSKKPDESRPGKKQEDRKLQVMLSYNREHREKVMEIHDFLEEKGFKVWIDQNNMAGDIYNAMADAVVTSDIICICYSAAYTESKNCEREAKFAVENNKPIVPLKMEDFKPPDWLRFIITGSFFVDFSGKYEDEEANTRLLRQLHKLEKDIIRD